MNRALKYHTVESYTTQAGVLYEDLELSYQLFGCPLHSAPVVMINHALTGNSDVASEHSGWWKDIVAPGKLIDTDKVTVIAFNIPGNGFDQKPENLIEDYKDFNVRDVALLFGGALKALGVKKLEALIGGSLGGGISWEMTVLYPELVHHLIVVASGIGKLVIGFWHTIKFKNRY